MLIDMSSYKIYSKWHVWPQNLLTHEGSIDSLSEEFKNVTFYLSEDEESFLF